MNPYFSSTYRELTTLEYGDSVINSVADILACIIGFALAWRLPTPATVIWIVLVEGILAFWIRDNLTLNLIMLLYPIRAIQTWQLGALVLPQGHRLRDLSILLIS